MRVAVVFGGASVEHEISIITGVQAVLSLNKAKYEVIPIYLTKDNRFLIGKDFDKLETFKQDKIKGKEVYFTKDGIKCWHFTKKIDVVVACVHGKGLEGGELAGFFEILQIPYTSLGVLGASLGQDKITFKKLMTYEKVNVLPFTAFTAHDWKTKRSEVLENIKALSLPVIIKPSNLGSSIGVKKVDNEKEIETTVTYLLNFDDRILVEKALTTFREFNCAIINQEYLSDVEEVITTHEILTFSDKYEEGPSKRIIPAAIDEDLHKKIEELTRMIAYIIDNKGVIRVDYLYDTNTLELYVNEVNTIPGSLSFYLFENKGLFFDELLDKLINSAIHSYYSSRNKISTFMSNVLNMKGIKK